MSEHVLTQLRGGFVSSCQPLDESPMNKPSIVAAMALSSVSGGASGLRIEGLDNLKAVKSVVNVPIIGIIKRDLDSSPVRITPYVTDVMALAEAGADIIAVDGTDRVRPESVAALITAIHQSGCLAMADCSTVEEALACKQLGADILGTTLSGYCGDEVPVEPDFQFIDALTTCGSFVMAEGRFNTPELAARAISSGADCVTIGSAITRIEYICRWFSETVKEAHDCREEKNEDVSVY